MNSNYLYEKKKIRAFIRNKRINLSLVEKRKETDAVSKKLKKFLKRDKKIAVYEAQGSELDLSFLKSIAAKRNVKIYVPVVDKHHKRLYFSTIKEKIKLQRIEKMDIVFLPLIAADNNGYRLGQGGGYYDFSLSFANCYNIPLKIGIGFNCQLVEYIPHEPHDIKLDFFVCEKKTLNFKNNGTTPRV